MVRQKLSTPPGSRAPNHFQIYEGRIRAFFDIANSHPNPLLVSAVSYEPPPPQHFCRRPRNVLIDPPDELTAEVEKLIEAPIGQSRADGILCRYGAYQTKALKPLAIDIAAMSCSGGLCSVSRTPVCRVHGRPMGFLLLPHPFRTGELQKHRAGGSVDPVPVSHKLIRKTLEEALSKIGYQCSIELLSKIVEKSTPISSRASSCTSSTTTNQASSSSTSRSASPNGKHKRKSSSKEDDNENSNSGSDNTVVASSNEGSESDGSNSKGHFTLVQGKKVIKKARAARCRAAASSNNIMETDYTLSSTLNTGASAPTSSKTTNNQVNSGAENKSVSGTKPTAPSKGKNPPPFYLLKSSNFVKISTDCTRLRINYPKAYLIENKVKFHTYALDEERELKLVIRGVPEDIDTDHIKSDLINQGFPLFAVYRITRRDGSSTGLILAVLPKIDEARSISPNLSKVCGLSGIRVKAPHRRGVPSQCYRCQRYGHASANCHVQSRCVKYLVCHWTSECPRSKDSSDKPTCVNCGLKHTANYGGCPKAPKVVSKPTIRTNKKPFNNKKTPPVKGASNFPALGAKKFSKIIDDRFVLAPMPSSNPWVKKQLPRAESEPSRETNRRGPPGPAPAH
ncbi:Nucleic-acid-binding protein from transposon X-element [Eumeta japonica]|uniref:Nucleic-acid-binding protein from transposon X-element n=1 Tax=Eumeta variegata TaxID=151549 RepID=A0A4C1UP03_EUMVA|nr:Nucleic-acid-binding protein from transposon X-element [Eumeta japonica]